MATVLATTARPLSTDLATGQDSGADRPELPGDAPCVGPGQADGHAEPATELALAGSALAALMRVNAELPLLHLVRLVAAKLAGHGGHCAEALHPSRGSLSLDEVRSRCRELLDALAPVERHAVLTLLIADVEGATR